MLNQYARIIVLKAMKTIYILITYLLFNLMNCYASEPEVGKDISQTLSVILPHYITDDRKEVMRKVLEQRLSFITGDKDAKAMSTPRRECPYWGGIWLQFINYNRVDLELLSRSLLVNFSIAFYRIITDSTVSKEELAKLRTDIYAAEDNITLILFQDISIITEKDIASLTYFEDKNLNKIGLVQKFTPEGLAKLQQEFQNKSHNWIYVSINNSPRDSFVGDMTLSAIQKDLILQSANKNNLKIWEMQRKYPLPLDNVQNQIDECKHEPKSK